MATPPRYFQKGNYYHVYNRGNRKQNIFFIRRDYERFLRKTLEYKKKFNITILCYCLMPNHFHFLVKQNTDISLTFFMLSLGTSYAKYFNLKYDEVGSLFQDRFRAKVVETEEYLLELSRYIHRNPIETQPYSTPGVELEAYVWSSYRNYLRISASKLVDPTFVLSYFSQKKKQDYKNWVEYDVEKSSLQDIKHLLFEDI